MRPFGQPVRFANSNLQLTRARAQTFRRQHLEVLVALVFVLLLWLSVQSTRDHGSTSSSIGRSSGCRIIYSVIGSASRASLTYQNESGGTEQMLVSLPWNIEFNARRGAFLYLSAQSRERNSAIEVEIRSNSIEVQKAQSYGDFVIATAHGRAQ